MLNIMKILPLKDCHLYFKYIISLKVYIDSCARLSKFSATLLNYFLLCQLWENIDEFSVKDSLNINSYAERNS